MKKSLLEVHRHLNNNHALRRRINPAISPFQFSLLVDPTGVNSMWIIRPFHVHSVQLAPAAARNLF